MTTSIEKFPVEADRHRAPGLLEGALRTELTPEGCDLGYWFRAVPEGTSAVIPWAAPRTCRCRTT